MKTIILVALLFSAHAYAIVPNTEYYELAQNRIKTLKAEVKKVELNLTNNPQHKLSLELKGNIEQEIKLIEQRVKLYKKLERQSLIMYSNP